VPNLTLPPKVAIIGANSQLLAEQLGTSTPLWSPMASSELLEEADCAIFIVSSNSGIVSADVEKWRLARDLYLPSIVVISDLESSDNDFEDMSAIASKMLDPVVTPFLVLHSDAGDPIALIDLNAMKILDYSQGDLKTKPAESEHIELVREFQEEYLENLDAAGEDSFVAALLFPAIPWIESRAIGVAQIKEYLELIPAQS
jgi:hypothetical protein